MKLKIHLIPAVASALGPLLLAGPARAEVYAFTTFAGSPGGAGYVDGVGTAARFYTPIGIAIDARGNLFVADGFDSTGLGLGPGSAIRRITPDGVVTTVAGSFISTGSVDGTGSEARFAGPGGIAIDANSNLFVADGAFVGSIRKITPGGVVTTLARGLGFEDFSSVAVDAAGNVFLTFFNSIRKITPEGVVTPFAGGNGPGIEDGIGSAARFALPSGLAIDSTGNLFVADTHNHTLRKITSGGEVSTIAGLAGFAGNADGMGSAARFRWPYSVAVDGNGNVFVGDSNGVRKITADGSVTTLAGAGNASDVSGPSFPVGVALGQGGEIFVTDSNRTVRKGVPFLGIVPAIATQPQSYIAARGGIAVFNVVASGSPAPTYQWTKNGSALAGVTDATLLLTNVTAATAGTYRCIVTNPGGWAESYSAVLTVGDAIDPGRFSNFSVQASVGAGRSVTAGFVVQRTGQKTVLIRGIGPGLAQFGIRGALADPAVTVISSTGERLAANDNWPAALASVFASTGAFALPAGSKDAAILLPLQPGAYSVALSSADAGAGEALIEIYELR